MRVALVISSLHAGGAERVISIMANYWAHKGWDVSILTLAAGDDVPFYELDLTVKHLPLDLAWVSANRLMGALSNLRRIWVIRRALARLRPDVVISFMDSANVLTLLASRGLRLPVVVSDRIDPAAPDLGRIWRRLRDSAYGTANVVTVQTARAKDYFRPAVRANCVVIPNPVFPVSPESSTGTEAAVVRPAIVFMGRLIRQKGVDLLLAAFARVRERFPEWHLVIIGEGPLRTKIEAQIAELGLEDLVALVGKVRHPEAVLRQADLFVLSSRYEGFPNALLEAMACGLPAVSFDCPSGPREIIRDGVDGILVPPGDVDGLSAALARLMSDEAERHRLGRRARDVTERFGLEKVMGIWEETLQRLVS